MVRSQKVWKFFSSWHTRHFAVDCDLSERAPTLKSPKKWRRRLLGINSSSRWDPSSLKNTKFILLGFMLLYSWAMLSRGADILRVWNPVAKALNHQIHIPFVDLPYKSASHLVTLDSYRSEFKTHLDTADTFGIIRFAKNESTIDIWQRIDLAMDIHPFVWAACSIATYVPWEVSHWLSPLIILRWFKGKLMQNRIM